MNISDRYQRVRMCVFRPEYLATHAVSSDEDFTRLIDTIVEYQEVIVGLRNKCAELELEARDREIERLNVIIGISDKRSAIDTLSIEVKRLQTENILLRNRLTVEIGDREARNEIMSHACRQTARECAEIAASHNSGIEKEIREKFGVTPSGR